jgi:hypothetical protein
MSASKINKGKECPQLVSEHDLECLLCKYIEASGSSNLYGFIDGTSESETLELFFRHAPEAEYYPLFLGTELERCLPKSPYLISIGQQSDFIHSVRGATDQQIIWFTSSIELDAQITYWKSLIHARLPNGELTLFRFWNGVTLHQYLMHLDRITQQSLLQPIQRLFTPSLTSDTWHLWSFSPLTNPIPLQTNGWWQIHQSHLSTFTNNFSNIQIQEIEDQLWRTMPDRLALYHPAHVTLIIREGLNNAINLGACSDPHAITFNWDDNLEVDGL